MGKPTVAAWISELADTNIAGRSLARELGLQRNTRRSFSGELGVLEYTRAVLLADVNSLIAHGLLAPSVISGLQGTNGHKNVMMDLGTLASILRKHAAKIADRTSIRPEELSAAEDLANKLGKALGLREQSPQVVAEVTRNRHAAFTLFVNTYDDVRAAVQYLRRSEGGSDPIMPSLYMSRGLRRKVTEEEEEEETTPATADTTAKSALGASAPTTTANNDALDGPFMH